MNGNKLVIDALRKKAKQLEDNLRHIQAVIKLYETGIGEESVPDLVPIASLRGQTQLSALIKIAKAGGGKFKISDARALLIKAGLINSPKGNAANILFNAINRSDRFRRIGRGEYELKPISLLPLVKSSAASGQ